LVHSPATPCSPPRHPRRHPLPTRSPPSPQLPRPTLKSDRGGSGAASRGGAGELSRLATTSRGELCASESSQPAPQDADPAWRREEGRRVGLGGPV
jgi:hypothetical protein